MDVQMHTEQSATPMYLQWEMARLQIAEAASFLNLEAFVFPQTPFRVDI